MTSPWRVAGPPLIAIGLYGHTRKTGRKRLTASGTARGTAWRASTQGYFDSNALMAPVTCGMTSFGTAIDSW